jgi:hypothetical protein
VSGNANPPIPGHHLLNEGHIFPLREGPGEFGHYEVVGYDGGCECGARPEKFPDMTGRQMKVWHREHKANLRAHGIGVITSDRHDRAAILHQVLDAAEDALRLGEHERVLKIIFVWSQRREHLLAGEETWEDQHV